MNTWWSWGGFMLSVALLVGYEWRVHHVGRQQPEKLARYANARLRMHWVRALGDQPGFEIVAVQSLRNSLMAASISASTAALAVMGALSMVGASLVANLARWSTEHTLHTVLQAVLVATLFASYVCSALSTRHYSHASFIMSMPVGHPERQALNPTAARHVRRAGLMYSWGLRLFLMVLPLVAGIVHPLAMLPATALLIVGLVLFDQPAHDAEVD
ncbi:DUF599 domain-containing protein [Ideonella sp.]|uniref:DUF599 domain-containing protein n=1 Tax=Ideonella sp. TaxID=1929293 RepID=UPI0035AF1CFC